MLGLEQKGGDDVPQWQHVKIQVVAHESSACPLVLNVSVMVRDLLIHNYGNYIYY